MKIKKWLEKNTSSLRGKTVAVTGSTGGIGGSLCAYLAQLGADLILLDRNAARSQEHAKRLVEKHPDVKVICHSLDLEDMQSVKTATAWLQTQPLDVLIHNAGAYSIPRKTCGTGLDNVFQINFASPYYMTKQLLPLLSLRGGKVVAVGSIAHNYSKADPGDLDFSTRKKASKVYGNAKRYLIFSLYALFQGEAGATLAITHPGITFTNITAHYPKPIFALIKHPMKIIFMRTSKACLSVLQGVFSDPPLGYWIGPGCFDVWGMPRTRKLSTCSVEEQAQIAQNAEKLYQMMV